MDVEFEEGLAPRWLVRPHYCWCLCLRYRERFCDAGRCCCCPDRPPSSPS